MKRITLTMTLALGCLMTTQSFGFDLLDRMLGSKGCGCDTACCEAPSCGSEAPCCAADPACGCEAPSCGCAADPACGCEAPSCGCAADPACGCESACPCEPACGCEAPSCDSGCGCGPKKGGLLSKLFGKKSSKGCDSCCEPACGAESPCGCSAAPACGCEAASCDSGCGCAAPKCGGLLSKLFGGKKSSCCDSGCDSGCDTGCGCAPSMAPVSMPSIHSVPEAPAPIVDPSASYQGKRRVVQASARYVR